MGDDGGIDGVGLGKIVHGFGEVAHLASVDDDGGELLREQSADRGLLLRAGGLEEDPLGAQGPDPRQEFRDASGGVGEPLAGRGGANVNIEVVLRDIDANEDALHGVGPPSEEK